MKLVPIIAEEFNSLGPTRACQPSRAHFSPTTMNQPCHDTSLPQPLFMQQRLTFLVFVSSF
jgi:hypothetical protein